MTFEREKSKAIEMRVQEDLGAMHPTPPAGGSVPAPPSGALLEAYKKHAEELRVIEERQNKIIALVLGILSAAATLLFKGMDELGRGPRVYLSLLALVIVWIGQHAINELSDLRHAVRDLLVRCEIGLRFYEVGAFLEGRTLYSSYELEYPKGGGWLKNNYWLVWLVCVGFIAMLFRHFLRQMMSMG